ncbi:MAG: SDR family NAD(P)-dependent oxidoreductase [Thermodesulfobacteriota bacterium]
MDLTGRVAVVTGAAQGIGEATAEKMALLGAKVGLLDVNLEKTEEVAVKLRQAGAEASAVSCDITRSSDIHAAVSRVVGHFGVIDILVNNAGWTEVHPFMEEDEAYWERLIAVNLKGPILVTRAVLPQMIERRRGKIVNVSSEVARMGMYGQVVYSAAKGGVISFTKSLAREVGRYGINVNCVCPGPVNTPLFRVQVADREFFKKATALRRVGEPSELASVIAFLCSSEADYVTGEVLSVAGGWGMAG